MSTSLAIAKFGAEVGEARHADPAGHHRPAAAVPAAPDVTVLINNAGIDTGSPVLTGEVADIRREFDTQVFGRQDRSRREGPVNAAT